MSGSLQLKWRNLNRKYYPTFLGSVAREKPKTAFVFAPTVWGWGGLVKMGCIVASALR